MDYSLLNEKDQEHEEDLRRLVAFLRLNRLEVEFGGSVLKGDHSYRILDLVATGTYLDIFYARRDMPGRKECTKFTCVLEPTPRKYGEGDLYTRYSLIFGELEIDLSFNFKHRPRFPI